MPTAPPPAPPAIWWNWTLDKINISTATGLPDDALHIHAGLLIMTLTAVILRRAPWTFWPWFAVVVAETANELYDLLQPFYPSDEGNLAASTHDFWMTLLWPTVILTLFSYFARRQARALVPPEYPGSADQRLCKGADLRADVIP